MEKNILSFPKEILHIIFNYIIYENKSKEIIKNYKNTLLNCKKFKRNDIVELLLNAYKKNIQNKVKCKITGF